MVVLNSWGTGRRFLRIQRRVGFTDRRRYGGWLRATCRVLMRAVTYSEAVSSASPGLSGRQPRLPWEEVAEMKNTPKGLCRSSATRIVVFGPRCRVRFCVDSTQPLSGCCVGRGPFPRVATADAATTLGGKTKRLRRNTSNAHRRRQRTDRNTPFIELAEFASTRDVKGGLY